MKQIFTILLLFCVFVSNAQDVVITRPKPQTTVSPKQGDDSKQKKSQRKSKSVVSTNQKVDLGLSVCWAGYNVGASSPEQPGHIFGWADPSGTKTMRDQNYYPSATPPMNICGSTQYDMARVNWGSPWRLPSKAEMEELKERCKWEKEIYCGVWGYKITGPNNNAIFLPVTKVRNSNMQNGTLIWKEWVPNHTGHYYSGELNTLGGRWPIDDARPYTLFISTEWNTIYVGGEGLRSEGCAVRPVCSK